MGKLVRDRDTLSCSFAKVWAVYYIKMKRALLLQVDSFLLQIIFPTFRMYS